MTMISDNLNMNQDFESLMAIAHRLIATREGMGYTQKEFCERAGIAPNTYNQWERAKGRPQLDMAIQLCRTYHLTLDWIYRGNALGLPADLQNIPSATRPNRVLLKS